MLKKHSYHWKELVIGENLNAIIYAHQNGSKIFSLHEPTILPFDHFYDEFDLGLIGIENGVSKYEIARQLTFNAALEGRIPFASNLASVQVDSENNHIKAITKNSSVVSIYYDKLRIFNTDGIRGLPFETLPEPDNYTVLDWFDVKSGTKHEHDYLIDAENSFVQKIYFYLSERIDGNTVYKDLVSKSILTKKELNNPDYSDAVARLKTISMMKEAGIKGTSNGVRQFLPIRLEFYRREVIPNKTFDFVEEGDIILDNRTEEQILNEWISSCGDSTSSRSAS
jgi:hypothetical protein